MSKKKSPEPDPDVVECRRAIDRVTETPDLSRIPEHDIAQLQTRVEELWSSRRPGSGKLFGSMRALIEKRRSLVLSRRYARLQELNQRRDHSESLTPEELQEHELLDHEFDRGHY